MNPTLVNGLVAVLALITVYGIWIGVHLIARHRMGERQIGCRGPMTDDFGNEVCCHTGEPCRRDEACESGETSPPSAPDAKCGP